MGCAANILALAIGCSQPPARSLDDIAKGYVRAALQVAQHQPALVDAWRGDASWRPGPREPVVDVRRRIAELLDASSTMVSEGLSDAERSRHRYLQRQLTALDLAARRLLGEDLTFAGEVTAAYGVPLRPPDRPAVAQAREALGALLPGTGTLGERHARFRRSVTIPPARASDVLHAALDACRTQTRAHISLPDDESLDLRLGADSAWDGFARYQGQHRSAIEISGQSPLDVSRALHLACHEAYPGHHTQDVLLDEASKARPELLLTPAFGPHLLIAEGAAEVGADLAFPPAERTRLYRDVLLPRAGLSATRAETLVSVETHVFALEAVIPDIIAAYLDSRTSREATLTALATEAAVMEPESLLAFAERQRTGAVVYVLGRHVVAEWIAAQGGDPWAALATLFSTHALDIN